MEKILYDGTKEEIESVRCECGEKPGYYFTCETFTIFCDKCRYVTRYIKSPVPNCIRMDDFRGLDD